MSRPRYRITLAPSGLVFEASSDQSLLKAARAARIVMPSSCRNGTCRTCLCRMQSGTVGYQIEWPGLSSDEKDEGLILPCVAVAQTDLVLDSPYAYEMAP